MPTREQRGHLGLSSRGGGMCPPVGDESQPVDGGLGQVAQLLGEFHPDPLAAPGVVEDAFFALVAVLREQHALNAELDALGVVGPVGDMGTLAPLVVDGGDAVALAFDEVQLGDDPDPVG